MKDLILIAKYYPGDSHDIAIGDCVYFDKNSSVREKI
jgi:hypothetical protein